MRDWNRPIKHGPRLRAKFVAYLWGIETEVKRVLRDDGTLFVAYLWGIETR